MERKHKFLFVCLLIILVWLPWPLGSNRPWAWPIMSFFTLSLLSSWALAWLYKPYKLPNAVIKAKLPLLLMCAWLFFLVLQIVPIPNYLLSIISPEAALAYTALDGNRTFSYISIDRGETLGALIKSCTYVSLFFLVLVTAQDQRRLKILVGTIIFTAVLQTLYGLMNVGDIMGVIKTAHNTVSGTYPNRNHYAAFIEMASSLAVGLIIVNYFAVQTNTNANSKKKVLGLINLILGPSGLILISIAIMLIGLFLSASRGGILAFSISLISVLSFVLLSNKLIARKRSYANGNNYVIKFLAFLVIGIAVFGSSEVLMRLDDGGMSGREYVWEPALIMAKDFLLVGSGLGTFQTAFAIYHPSYGQFWWHAHMNYIQLFIELGIFGFILFSSSTVVAVLIILRSFYVRRNPMARGLMVGVMIGVMSILIHEFVDFQFFIPANAAYFFVLLGIGVAATTLGHRRVKSSQL